MVTIISGGQTGADRAALDAAIESGLPYAGWCPHGGWAEDYPDPPGVLGAYPRLRETPERAPGQRTDWNVRDSDALLVLIGAGGLLVSEGTRRAVRLAETLNKPLAIVDVMAPDATARARGFLVPHANEAIGIGGPRESEAPGLYENARRLLVTVLGDLGQSS